MGGVGGAEVLFSRNGPAKLETIEVLTCRHIFMGKAWINYLVILAQP